MDYITKQLLKIAVLPVLLCGQLVYAAHNDTTINGLRVTLANMTGNVVTVTVSGGGYDSSSLSSARLGSQFFYDSSLDRWLVPVPPAVDWGDGQTIPNTGIPFDASGTTSSAGGRTFSGQFVHTYTAPGNYTIRVFATNVYAYDNTTGSGAITSGNAYSAYPSFATPSGSSGTLTDTTTVIGLTNTLAVAVGSVTVPTMTFGVLAALGLALAGLGMTALRRA